MTTRSGTEVATARSVRDATFDVMRRHGMTRIFGNPGSTEIPFLVDLPGDIEFVMGLHEGAVVSMATGYALARDEPSFVNLHTTPGLGNAVAAIANARDFHAPLVIVVGQQDRRQLTMEPFLAGRALERLAGEYPVWTDLPLRAQDVPGAIARAYHEARAAGGPALVVVPMSDWEEPADGLAAASPAVVLRPTGVSVEQLDPLVQLLKRRSCRRSSSAPARTAPMAGARLRRWPSGCGARSGTSRSARARDFPRITRSLPATCTGAGG